MKFELDQSQRKAVHAALCANGFAIITGGAGTGKTTIIREISNSLHSNVVILAPTGKAAARIRDNNLEANTIHRSLLYDGTKFNRKKNFDKPVIIDESSMVDSALLAALLEYRPPKLIMVGDANQLPPVGKGQPFHDLIDIAPHKVSRLTTCHRAQGAIHIAAKSIIEKEAIPTSLNSGGEVWQMIHTGDQAATMSKLAQWLRAGKYDPQQDIILAPRYGSDDEGSKGGIIAINKMARFIINKSAIRDFKFGKTDRIIITKNFSELDLWNGDCGTVLDVDDKGAEVLLDRTKSSTRVENAILNQHAELAYCLSVHKSQGSEYRRVFFVCQRRDAHMLTRELCYTAITRAKEAAVVLGETSAFFSGLNRRSTKTTILQLAKKEIEKNELD